tara:strand:+ start:1145 stop:1780 length:636 start_codon:yes stop_codon:yes gene_type:complete
LRCFFTYLLLFFALTFYSQQNKFLDKFSVGMNFKLPKTIENTTFRKTIYGVGDIEGHFQYKVIPNFEISLGYKYGYYDLNSLAFQANLDGQMETHTPFLKLAYVNEISEKIFLDIGLKGGYNFSYTNTTNCRFTFSQQAYRIEPEFGVFMYSSDLLSFGLILSYNFWFAEFGPEHFCMSSISGMNASESNGIYQTFCAGLGFKTYFPSKSN